jgi:hypothetical protein
MKHEERSDAKEKALKVPAAKDTQKPERTGDRETDREPVKEVPRAADKRRD